MLTQTQLWRDKTLGYQKLHNSWLRWLPVKIAFSTRETIVQKSTVKRAFSQEGQTAWGWMTSLIWPITRVKVRRWPTRCNLKRERKRILTVKMKNITLARTLLTRNRTKTWHLRRGKGEDLVYLETLDQTCLANHQLTIWLPQRWKLKGITWRSFTTKWPQQQLQSLEI
jgi:hypothetical protein